MLSFKAYFHEQMGKSQALFSQSQENRANKNREMSRNLRRQAVKRARKGDAAGARKLQSKARVYNRAEISHRRASQLSRAGGSKNMETARREAQIGRSNKQREMMHLNR